MDELVKLLRDSLNIPILLTTPLLVPMKVSRQRRRRDAACHQLSYATGSGNHPPLRRDHRLLVWDMRDAAKAVVPAPADGGKPDASWIAYIITQLASPARKFIIPSTYGLLQYHVHDIDFSRLKEVLPTIRKSR